MPDFWPFVPLIEGTVEKLSWLTDVRQTVAGEMRDSLRDARQRFIFSFNLDDTERAEAIEIASKNMLGDFEVPDWPSKTLLDGSVLDSDTVIAVDTNADYRTGGRAVIYKSRTEYALVEIAAVAVGQITLSAPVGVTLTGSARAPLAVAPLRTAYLVGGLTESKFFRGRTVAAAEFECRDGVDIGENNYVTLGSYPVLTDPSVVVTPLDGAVARAVDYVDSGLGTVVGMPVRNVVISRETISFIDQGLSARWSRRRFLHYLRGRDGAFWLPSWSRDLEMALQWSSAGNFMTVAPLLADVADYVGRRIQVDDGAFIHREVTSAIVSGNNHRLYMSPPGRDVPTTAVVSFLGLRRLDADVLELQHSAADICRVNVAVREVSG